MASEERVTYRAVLANREFTAILLSQSLSLVGDQIARIALAALVFAGTHSALAASATFAASYVTYLLAGPLMSSLSDRYDRRAVMVISDIVRGLAVLVLVVADVPWPGVYVLVALLSLLAPAFDSARGATLPDVLKGDGYIKGNALCNLAFQAAVVGGFVAGGALLAGVGAHRALVVDAGTFFISAGALYAAVQRREHPHTDAIASLWRESAAGIKLVAQDPTLRRLLVYAVLGAVAVAAPESLAIPLVNSLQGGSVEAGLLTASIPAGFILGSFAILRLPAERRPALLPWLVLLAVIPLLVTPLLHNVPGLIALWAVSGLGSALQLIASAAYVSAAPASARARAYGVATTALMAGQGAAQLAAGAVASALGMHGPGIAVALLALMTLACLPFLAGFVRSERGISQESREFVR